MNDRAVLSPAAPPAVPHAAVQPWRWRLWAMVSTYLPLLTIALLALGSWWLVQNTPMPGGDVTAAPLRHEPDYEMQTFVVQRFAREGPLKAEIEGDELRHYPDTDTLEIDNVRLRSIGPDGRVTVARARQAIANGAGTEVQLMGQAEVVREATGNQEAIYFRSEFLHAFLDTERVQSHLPVTVISGGTRVTAGGMEYDNLDRVVTFRGRMRAIFDQPAPKP